MPDLSDSGIAALGLLLCMMIPAASGNPLLSETPRPNVVILLADDLGWNDVGYHGSEIRTPNLDTLAGQGIQLHQFHTQPICSPTRAALMTGKHPQRLGIYRQFAKNAIQGLPEGEQTIADYLKQASYQTWLVGKWHLGYAEQKFHPNSRGFDHFYGNVTGGIGYWDHVHGGAVDWQRNGQSLREKGYSTHLLAEEATSLIRSRDSQQPFFLVASFNAPHLPNEAPNATIESYQGLRDPHRRVHAAMVTELDEAVGDIVDALRQEGELDNTLIWFMSDNGGLNRDSRPDNDFVAFSEVLESWFGAPLPITFLEFIRINTLEGGSDNTPLRYGKSSVYEGGARVPSFVTWPGQLGAGELDDLITVQDVLPTILSAAGVKVPSDLDGQDVWSGLQHRLSVTPKDFVTRGQLGAEAYYQWPWKLITDGDHTELYNLEDDPTETRDLASANPQRVADLLKLLAGIPRAPSLHIPTYQVVLDPDFFGGEEDRQPWAELTTQSDL